jgi:hypothetical protein
MKMKIAAAAAVAVLAGAGLYFVGRKARVASAPPPGAEASAPAAAPADGAPAATTLSGKVAKVDASSRRLSLEEADGKTTVYSIAPDALVTRGRSNRKADVAALKAGQKVTVSLKNALVASVHIEASSSRKARLRKAATKAG